MVEIAKSELVSFNRFAFGQLWIDFLEAVEPTFCLVIVRGEEEGDGI